MDALSFITKMLSQPILQKFISTSVPDDRLTLVSIRRTVTGLHGFMHSRKFRELPEDIKQAVIECVRLTAHNVGNVMSMLVCFPSSKQSSSSGDNNLKEDWNQTLNSFNHIASTYHNLTVIENEGELDLKKIGPLIKSLDHIKRIENMFLETQDSSNCITLNEEQSRSLFLKKAFPDLIELKGSSNMSELLKDLSEKLENLPHLIYKACEGQPLVLLLIGGLLSYKQRTYDNWNSVKDDLWNIEESDNQMWNICTYCYRDLSMSLQKCFLLLACYPIGYEIPATSLTQIWIAEGFINLDEGETPEELANKYLEELVQRSLVFVSRSLLGTIKNCRVHRSIHEIAIQTSCEELCLFANPDQEDIKSMWRLAIHQHNMKQFTVVKNNRIRSLFAFNSDNNVLGSVMPLLRVLALTNCRTPITVLPKMMLLRYLNLRGSNISAVPEKMFLKRVIAMKCLQTLDVRDTSIETLPISLWNISTLRHVYVKPSPQNKGPPHTSKLPNLQILKTVAACESWLENVPHFLIHLRKLSLSYWNNPDLKDTTKVFSHMDKLISMAITGNNVPSEIADIRAFPNLETVKSIKLDGIWNCRKLLIDNVKFPPNLTKLTLTNFGLKEDPMPKLEKLGALKSLKLQDRAYIGKQMVCSAGGFPQLQFLKLKKLENLVNLVIEPRAMSQLTTLCVVQCGKLNNPSNLRVTITDIDE